MARTLWNPEVHYCVHNTPPIALSWARWIQSTPSRTSFKFNVNILFQSTSRTYCWSLSFGIFLSKLCIPFILMYNLCLAYLTLLHYVIIMLLSINAVTYQHIARQRIDKHPEIRARNNRTNVYSSLLGNNQRANGLVKYLSRDLLSMCSAPCPVLSNRTVNTSKIISVFYGVRAEGL
jgi:hypothetical protein